MLCIVRVRLSHSLCHLAPLTDTYLQIESRALGELRIVFGIGSLAGMAFPLFDLAFCDGTRT